jgi:hypothetical protein
METLLTLIIFLAVSRKRTAAEGLQGRAGSAQVESWMRTQLRRMENFDFSIFAYAAKPLLPGQPVLNQGLR